MKIKILNKFQPVSEQPVLRPIRPNNFSNGHLGDWTPDTPCNTPNYPQNPQIIVSKPNGQFGTSQIAIDSDSKVGTENPEIGKFSTTQIVDDSASNADVPTPVGEKMETTITSAATSSKVENYDDKEGNISSQTIVVTSTESTKSEFHSVTSSTNKVTLSSSSEEPIGEIVSQIVNDSFNKNAAAISETKTSSVVTTSIFDKKTDEKHIETTQIESFPPMYIAICPPKPLSPEVVVCPVKLEPEIEKSQEENANGKEERPPSTFEAFKNFVGGIMTSAVNAISPQSEKTEPKYNNEESKIDSSLTIVDSITKSKPKEDHQIETTQVVTNSSDDIGLSSPGLVKELISSKVEIIPSGSKDENELISSSVTKESSAFVELPNGFHKEVTTSTVEVISSHPSSEFKTYSHVVSSEVTTSGPVIVELSTLAYDSKANDTSSEPKVTDFKSACEESHTASSSLETTTSSTYHELSSTSYESATDHFSSSHEVSSTHDHVDTYDSSTNDTHDYSSFDVD
ncbi:uncharacterized protein LOC129566845 isoform X2 [Sitodiplosis mosellana]|uniref:uncharacterized protein LOC129566845 isoform X2 n=1 Tax=Sitodiplosis mosellana TaxID=263140 RepID=UPI002443FB87|nr:uncharacterized protein LOC129566845 isoform X2 [Sitodiplosis mosellana]